MAHACYLYSEEAEAGRLLAVDNSGLLHKPNKTYTHTHTHYTTVDQTGKEN